MTPSDRSYPGQYWLEKEAIEINQGRRPVQLTVKNSGDRPIQVGSHFHFADANGALVFDRGKARGMRLNIPAGTAVRFEPGDERDVELIALGGRRRLPKVRYEA